MSSETGATSPEPDELQFDHAEFEETGSPDVVACASCRKPIADRYYEINGTIFCEPCRHAIEAQFYGGSKLGRFARAVVFGSLAALVGTIAYTTFKILSPIDISLVAILVGFLVGKMVRKGSKDLGGLAYQLLAMFLTYTSLAMTYFFWIIYMMAQMQDPGQAAAKPGEPVKAEAGKNANAQPPAPQAQPVPAGEQPEKQTPNILALLILAFSMPVILMKSSPIMIAFVGFALWEAWKFNAPLKLTFTGPYRVGEGDPFGGGAVGHV